MERNGMAINKEKENLDCVMIFFLSYFTNSSYREREKILSLIFFLGLSILFYFFSLWVTLTI